MRSRVDGLCEDLELAYGVVVCFAMRYKKMVDAWNGGYEGVEDMVIDCSFYIGAILVHLIM